MNFDILFSSFGSRILESFDEGVEFGFQNLNHGREWIPLTFYSFQRPNRRDKDIKIGPELMSDDTIATIRGYNVSIFLVGGRNPHRAELKLCGSEIMQNNASLSFRWLQTVVSNNATNGDPAYLDNIRISVNTTQECVLFNDDYNNEMMIK